MVSDTESSLIAGLESSDYRGIRQRFSDFLKPLADFVALEGDVDLKKTKKNQKNKKKNEVDWTLIRPLAKKFLPFLNQSLSLLPKRLSESLKLGGEEEERALELFDTYKLCLDCLSCLSSQLSCKPYSIHAQRVRLVHCFEAWGRFGDAEREGFSILESLQSINFAPPASKSVKGKKIEGQFLPDLTKENADPDLAMLLVEVVVTLVKCVFMSKTKDGGAYRKVLKLVDQIGPWLRVLDAKVFEKLHGLLVNNLNKCTLFMVEDYTYFDGDLVHAFCVATLTECLNSSVEDLFPKFARRIFSSLFSQGKSGSLSSGSLLILDIVRCALTSIPCKCKVAKRYSINEFLDLVCYCANKCRIANIDIARVIAKHLNEIASDVLQGLTPVDLILRLYAAGLNVTDDFQSNSGEISISESSKEESATRVLLDDGENLQHIADVLVSLESYFHIACNENGVSLGGTETDSRGVSCPAMESDFQDSKACNYGHGEASLLSYLNALEFLCQPFSELINTMKKQILAEREAAFFSTKLNYIQDAFRQFCDVFFICFRSTSERERDRFHESHKTLLRVAIAAFTVSVRTKGNIQRSVDCIDHIISSKWIQSQELKFLLIALYNIGVILYRSKQVKQASVALELCCRASWTCVSLLCMKFMDKSEGIHDELSEDGIIDFITEACAKSAFLLDVLHQCGSCDVNRSIVESLLSWSTTVHYFKRLSGPTSLVKQWVKIMCKEFKDVEDNAPTLYSLLSKSSPAWSKRMMGIILEQELLAYEEMNAQCPDLCQRMQLEIINILLLDVYDAKDDWLQKSRVLMRKGRAFRARGIVGLNSCIQCLSEAIFILNDVSGKPSYSSASTCHQLALAYCLRALCTQEAEPNSEVILQDIHHALKLWSTIHIPGCWSDDDHCELVTENAIPVLYRIGDLLSLKGYTHFQYDIYKLIIILLKRKNVPLEKSLAILWAYRRLTHALCMSPVDEVFILNLSKQFGVNSNSVGFWISCIKDSEPLLVGFRQKFSLSHSILPQGNRRYHLESFMGFNITLDEVKKAALDLISSVPVPSHSAFLAGYLYYDLCERFISNGRLLEALSYAKEARRLRGRLLRESFFYSIEQQPSKFSETGETTQRHSCSLTNLELYGSVAADAWAYVNNSWDMESGILTPWIILQCYLESTLQVGIIHEAIGNGAEAEAILLGGRNISCIQGLPVFRVAFASVLGKIFRKKQLWDLAENELNGAKKALVDSRTTISCNRCKLTLEISIDQQIGDLTRSRFCSTTAGPLVKSLSFALDLYRSALEKLNLSEQENSLSISEETNIECTMACKTSVEVEYDGNSTNACFAKNQSDTNEFHSLKVEGEGSQGNMKTKRGRRPRNASKHVLQEQILKSEHNPRLTRSRYQSTHNKSVQVQSEEESRFTKHSNGNHAFTSSDAQRLKGSLMEPTLSNMADFGCEDTCFCNGTNCWKCLLQKVMETGSMKDFIYMKWEFHRRRLSLRLLIGIGKCVGIHGETHEAHEVFWQSISLLVSRKPLCQTYSGIPQSLLQDFIGKESPGDVFAVERAAILYNICWFSVKNYPSECTRTTCCDLSSIEIPRVLSWLLRAFILCRELPLLFQKVSRLLAAIFLLSTSGGLCSSPLCFGNALSVSHWAAYFHQASIGTHLNHQFLSSMCGKLKIQDIVDLEGSHFTSSTSTMPETCNFLRLAPEKVEYLEEFVIDFFRGLPSTTVICISFLGDGYVSLLREMLLFPSSFPALMLISRLNSKSQPIVMLLPVDLILEEALDDDDALSSTGSFSEAKKNSSKKWSCPWGYTVVDDVAPLFKLILEENYLSSSISPLEDTQKNRLLWWTRRKKLDCHLGQFLKDIEDSWLGPWKCLLLGERSDCKHLDSVLTKLMGDLKRKCEFDAHESLLRVILGGARCASETEACVSQLFLYKGYFGRGGRFEEEICGTSSVTCTKVETWSGLARQLILEAACDVEEEWVSREPIILVLDSEVQMLPWENLPILRKQEVYRLPSVGSISAILNTSCHHQEQAGKVAAVLPLIDPLDAFYLLNPSGDLCRTQIEFEDWFRNQNFEGKAGTAPTTEELIVALKNHDLFIYFGHGSGTQYISGNEIQKLETCAATLLMGCSSGSLSLMGCYTPQGAPLSYLLAGSPVIIANLWEVTDKDIDRFGRAMLAAWLQERSTSSIQCSQCNLVVKEFGSMSIGSSKENARKVPRRKNLEEASSGETCKECSGPRPKIASFMSQAREACTLPFLIGASPVCYGVPTVIGKKKSL